MKRLLAVALLLLALPATTFAWSGSGWGGGREITPDADVSVSTVSAGTVTGTTVEATTVTTTAVQASGQISAGTEGVADTSGTITVNWNNGNRQYVTLTATGRTLSFANPSEGAAYSVILLQDGTGSRTITTWPTIKWRGGAAPTLTTTAAHYDIVSCLYVNSIYFCDVTADVY